MPEQIDVSDLNAEQIQLVIRFTQLVRGAAETEAVRAELRRMWGQYQEQVPPLPEDQVEGLAQEAVAYARRK